MLAINCKSLRKSINKHPLSYLQGGSLIIGVTGTNGSGKDTVGDILKEIGFNFFSCSQIIREEAAERNIYTNRENMIALGNELRETFGAGILSRRICQRIKENGLENVVVASIRHPAEIEELKKTFSDFILIAVDAPLEVRYQRVRERNHATDEVSFEDFQKHELLELNGKESQQQLRTVMSIADYKLLNDSSFDDLKKKVKSIIDSLKESPKRVSWQEYFMRIAKQVATRSTCDRKRVGCVIVGNKTILSTGYNGSIRGMPHCDDVGHDMENGHCIATVHAETNAIIQAAKNGVKLEGAELYTTSSPCWNCFKLIANSGIKKIYYGEFYRSEKSKKIAEQIGIELIKIDLTS